MHELLYIEEMACYDQVRFRRFAELLTCVLITPTLDHTTY